MNDLVETRRNYSEERMKTLRSGLSEHLDELDVGKYTVFAAGSYGRSEAGEHSDLDLFFVHADGADPVRIEMAIERAKEVVTKQGFLPLTERFLHPYNSAEATNKLGSPEDDAENHFTARMLLLLESKPVFNDAFYELHLGSVVRAYFRDYHAHVDEFRPIFLVNDIVRYWKTICLNYENRRNETKEAGRVEAKVKNFKLKYSRLTTCYATIAGLSCLENASPEQVIELVQMTPLERLGSIKKTVPELGDNIDRLIQEYSWFLSMTELSVPDLHGRFEEREDRRVLFERAEAYGDSFYEMLKFIDGKRNNKLMRFIAL